MRKFIWLLVFTPLLILNFIQAQEKVQINGQIRFRFEAKDNDFNHDTGYDSFNLLRTRIGFKYIPTKNITAFFQLQDSRALGEEDNTFDGSAKRFDMHQAYLQVDSLFQIPLNIRLGRYEVKYRNERLIGAVGWHNVGRTFNGVTAAYQTSLGVISAFSFKIKENRNPGNKGDLNFSGLWGHLLLNKYFDTDLFLLWRKEIGLDKRDEKTIGANIISKFGNLTSTIELAYQMGRLDSLTDISASMAAINLSYSLPGVSFKPTILAGIDYLSGDDRSDSAKSKVFNTLYATNHKFYGIMDFFLSIPVHTSGYGLTDLNIGLKAVLCEKSNAVIRYHRFLSSEKFILENDTKADHFGDELDLIVNYKFNPYINLQTGGGLFFPGEIFESTRGKDSTTFFYLSVVANL